MSTGPAADAKKTRKSTLPDWVKAGRGAGPAAPETAPPSGELRLSRPLLGVGLAAILLVVLAAFGFGWQSGKKSALAQAEAKHKEEIARITRNMAQVQNGAAVAGPTAWTDPREPGLNYWRLCQVPATEARKYADFLAAEGRRTLQVSVVRPAGTKPGVPDMVTLLVVNRGYRYGSDRVEIEKSRTELLALGDRWAKKNKGGNPFRSLMLEQFRK